MLTTAFGTCGYDVFWEAETAEAKSKPPKEGV